jgi:hypothetical protein
VLTLALAGGGGCSQHSPVDPWEAAKFAHKAKNRADLLTALQQLPAEVYALKLSTDCISDITKCIEALQVLEFAYILTEGEDSAEAQIACELKKIFALAYLIDIHTNLQMKLTSGTIAEADAAPIRARMVDIEKIQDRHIKQCERHK